MQATITSQTALTTSNPMTFPAPADVAAYESLRSTLEAMSPEQFIVINTDIGAAVTTVLRACEDLRALRSEVVRQTPLFDVTLFDRARDMALALYYADGYYALEASRDDGLPNLADEGARLREVLRATAVPLVKLGMFPGSDLEHLDGGTGYRAIAHDLAALASHFRAHWVNAEGKVPIDAAVLDRANALVVAMLDALAVRDRTGPAVVHAARMRQAAFTLLFRSWQQIRRVVAFLRPEGDEAEQIAPSLYVRGPVVDRKKDAEQPAKPTAAPVVAVAKPTDDAASPFAGAAESEPHAPGSEPFRT